MARNNEENFTDDDTYEAIDEDYRRMQANDEDENDEGTIEYLDLELENETLEQYCTEAIASSTTKPAAFQPSVLKTSYESVEQKSAPKHKPTRTKSAMIVPERSVTRTRSSTDNSANCSGLKRTADCLASASVHAAVDTINARLADSVKAVNGRATKKALANNGDVTQTVVNASGKETSKVENKSEMDSLDLFFQSMAQTVLNLPSQVQAKIKMDICKVIAMAEIKYCRSDNVQGVSKV